MVRDKKIKKRENAGKKTVPTIFSGVPVPGFSAPLAAIGYYE
jgi:hypothetical protein